jgi:hypothetical protein
MPQELYRLLPVTIETHTHTNDQFLSPTPAHSKSEEHVTQKRKLSKLMAGTVPKHKLDEETSKLDRAQAEIVRRRERDQPESLRSSGSGEHKNELRIKQVRSR